MVFAVALSIRIIDQAGLPPHPDDLLHLYAARSYLDHGTLSIFSGVYLRSADFTYLVAASLKVFGDTLLAARLPALVCGAGIVACAYAWLRSNVGRGPALIAASMLAIMAPALDVSVLIRFYTLQSLLFLSGAILIYGVVTAAKPSWRSLPAALFAILLLAEAARLQIVSAVGILGLLTWAALVTGWRLRERLSWRARLAALGLLLLSAALVGFVALETGILGRMWELYRAAVLWAEPERNNYKYYYHELTRSFGLLMDLLPFAAVVAFLFYPLPALFCATLLFVGIIVHSFAGMKLIRYMSYLLPLLACLWAMAAWPLLTFVGDRAAALVRRRAPRAARLARAGICCFAALLVFKAVPVFERPARALILPNADRVRDSRDQSWMLARDQLRPLVRRADVLVVDDDLLADYHVARPDIVLSKTRLLENTPPDEFTRDFRTGTPTISNDASVRTLLACFRNGVILTYEPFLEWLPPETLTFLAANARRLDPAPSLTGYAWDEPRGEPPASCDAVRQLVAPTATMRHAAP